MTPQQIDAMKLALEALKNNKPTHFYCEDKWYSCPKHEDGCADEREGDECNCGADEINAEFDKAITALEEVLAEHAMQEVQRLGQEIEQAPVAWLLTDKKINSLQVDDIQRLISRLKHAHHTDLCVRINGKDEWFEADWLKHMVRASPPQRKPLTYCQECMRPNPIDGTDCAHGIKETK